MFHTLLTAFTRHVCCMCYRLHKLLEQEPNNEKIYFNLGMLSMDEHDFKAALKWFDKATQVDYGPPS